MGKCQIRWIRLYDFVRFFSFFEVVQIVVNIVCYLSENQNFYMRHHFGTYSIELWLLVYVRTCGTKNF